MTRPENQDHVILPHLSRASEHSIRFSDLRADPDIRRMRLWLAVEVEKPTTWKSIDIARGGLSVVNRLQAVEHSNTRKNADLLKRVAVSAYTLYQHDKITDDDGNFAAFVLPRNAFLQLGQMPGSHFDVLRGSSLAANHIGLHVDDNDILAIEARDLENAPQIEVIDANSETAVEIGSATRNYVSPDDIGTGYVTRSEVPTAAGALHGKYATVPPQFISGVPIRTVDNVERIDHLGQRQR